MERLKSRKFWITVSAGTLLVFGRELGLNLTEEAVYGVVGIVATYLGIQGYADSKDAKGKK